MPFNLDAESIQKILWLVLLIVFAASEAVTVGLTSIWFAAGALCALIAALLGGPLWIQITLFLAVSLLCLAAVRPLAKRHLNDRVEPTNADRVIGAEAQVTEDIDNIHGKGAVIIRGMTWSARSENDSIIAVGTRVRVLRIEGVKVFVEPIAVSIAAGEPKSW
ncbi:MAG: NfeD family protein [Oscillospiraceae bacterium]|nr:NfeD family protein [Oscillospiraceae bacterium]